jgi:FecR protein
MIRREWLLGVGLLSGGLGVGMAAAAHPALADGTIGAVAAVKPDAFGAPPSAAEQTLVLGANVVENEKIRTTADGTANLIFADRSTLTVGKGSEVTLDKFVYDPGTKTGSMVLNLGQGALRFIGGQLSKDGNVTVKTPTATMTVRGGIALFFTTPDGGTVAVMLYGNALTDLGTGQEINRPGFMFRFPPGGGAPEIVKISDADLAGLLKQFNTQTGVGGQLPDQDIALIEEQLRDGRIEELIALLRDQVDDLSQKDNPALDALRQSLTQGVSAGGGNTNPYAT